MPKCLIGLDLGTNCGFAVSASSPTGTAIVSGAWDLSIDTSHDSPSLRFEKFATHLDGILALSPQRVFYEVVRRHRGIKAGHIYGAFLAKMQERCDHFNVPFHGLSVQEIKKFATGKGNASKDEMIRAMQVRGYDPKCDNEADALAILLCGYEMF